MPKKLQQRWAPSVLLLLLLSLGCASAGGAGGTASGRSRTVLPRDEMIEAGVNTLYDAVLRLRPTWLNTRGGSRSMGLETGVVVFQGQSMLGNPEVLKEIAIDAVAELRFLDGSTASSTLPGLGSRHVTGAIILVTRPAGH
jgi:hypothetical protein